MSILQGTFVVFNNKRCASYLMWGVSTVTHADTTSISSASLSRHAIGWSAFRRGKMRSDVNRFVTRMCVALFFPHAAPRGPTRAWASGSQGSQSGMCSDSESAGGSSESRSMDSPTTSPGMDQAFLWVWGLSRRRCRRNDVGGGGSWFMSSKAATTNMIRLDSTLLLLHKLEQPVQRNAVGFWKVCSYNSCITLNNSLISYVQ